MAGGSSATPAEHSKLRKRVYAIEYRFRSPTLSLVLFLPIGGVLADKLGRASASAIAITDLIMAVSFMSMSLLFLTGNATVLLLLEPR